MKVDKIEYKRVINDAGHLEYDLLQYLEKNREIASPEIKRTEIDYLIDHDIQHRIIQNARKSLLGDKIILKRCHQSRLSFIKKYTDFFFALISDCNEKAEPERSSQFCFFLFFKMFLVNVFDCLVWINHNIQAFCFSLIFVD